MKKILSFVVSFMLVCGSFSMNAFANEIPIQTGEIKTAAVDMEDVMASAAAKSSETMTLSKDMASKSGTDTVTSIGQLVDLRAAIPFIKTNRATSECKSTVLAGDDANVRFIVSIQGSILQNQSGFDGFTVFGGAKMIIEYK